MNSPTDNAGSSFGFLQQNWADLAELARKAERARDRLEPDVVAFRLRILAEEMVSKLFHQIGLPVSPDTTQLDRLREIEKADLLDRRLMAKFHTIRKIGNRAAHNKPVTQEQAVSLVEDAFSLLSYEYQRFGAILEPRHSTALMPCCVVAKDGSSPSGS